MTNLQIVQRMYTAFGNRDRDTILELFDPQIEWVQNEGFPGGGRHIGAEAVWNDVFAEFRLEWDVWQAVVSEWIDANQATVKPFTIPESGAAAIEPNGDFAVSDDPACDCEKTPSPLRRTGAAFRGASGQLLSPDDSDWKCACAAALQEQSDCIASVWPHLSSHTRDSILTLIDADLKCREAGS